LATLKSVTTKAAAPAAKSAAPKSAAPASKPAAFGSAAAPASKSVASHPKRNLSQVTMTAQDGGQDYDEELAVGGMLDEDDSKEQELAMSSPMKGNELRAKVEFF